MATLFQENKGILSCESLEINGLDLNEAITELTYTRHVVTRAKHSMLVAPEFLDMEDPVQITPRKLCIHVTSPGPQVIARLLQYFPVNIHDKGLVLRASLEPHVFTIAELKSDHMHLYVNYVNASSCFISLGTDNDGFEARYLMDILQDFQSPLVTCECESDLRHIKTYQKHPCGCIEYKKRN